MTKIKIRQDNSDFLHLIQFTDTHIFANESDKFDGVDTFLSFQSVIEHARQTDWPPDAVLVTGDLVHDPHKSAYGKLRVLLSGLDVPVFCLPGNHDNPEIMRTTLIGGKISAAKCFTGNNWAVFMLNTYMSGTHAGRLDQSELDLLEQLLSEHQQDPCLICLHHPPVKINSPWMDAMSLENPEDFFNIIDQHTQVRGILWGHIHQEFESRRNNIRLMASPSTCVQFKPASTEYIRDDKNAGYRVLRLTSSGKIKCKIITL